MCVTVYEAHIVQVPPLLRTACSQTPSLPHQCTCIIILSIIIFKQQCNFMIIAYNRQNHCLLCVYAFAFTYISPDDSSLHFPVQCSQQRSVVVDCHAERHGLAQPTPVIAAHIHRAVSSRRRQVSGWSLVV